MSRLALFSKGFSLKRFRVKLLQKIAALLHVWDIHTGQAKRKRPATLST